MFPYILFALLVLLLYCFKKPAGILIVMIAFSVLRYDVGWDYISYYEICRDSVQLGMAEDRYSFVWNALFNFAYTQETPHLGIAIPAVFTYLILYVALRIYFEKISFRYQMRFWSIVFGRFSIYPHSAPSDKI